MRFAVQHAEKYAGRWKRTSMYGGAFFYAQPPIGPLRFRPAQPVSRMGRGLYGNGIRPACPQRKRRVGTSEDCLYLNIWSPRPDGKKRAVLFFIHGGSFAGGRAAIPNTTGRPWPKAGT